MLFILCPFVHESFPLTVTNSFPMPSYLQQKIYKGIGCMMVKVMSREIRIELDTEIFQSIT